MSKILTAEEFLDKKCGLYIDKEFGDKFADGVTPDILIEFAKIHVQEALKTALDEVPYGGSDEIRYEDVVHILDCYNLDNIK